MKIAVGDEVRVYYHPPGPTRSFVEGVVSRVEVSTLRGRVFVVDATYEVILDREQPVKNGYQNYVLYERWEEFQGGSKCCPRHSRNLDALQSRSGSQRCSNNPSTS